MITKFNNFIKMNESLILEKSSLTSMGVPHEVMRPVQKDFSLESDSTWTKLNRKSEVDSVLKEVGNNLIIQIAMDSITVFATYESFGDVEYFMDTYTQEDESEWGGGYIKQERETVSRTFILSLIESGALIYKLDGGFSVKKQPERRVQKQEAEFETFTTNFKEDFLKNFNNIIRRIVGKRYDKAKGDIIDKAKQIERDSKMIIYGLDNPLEGPNGMTILDEFIGNFEEEYSEFFGEHVDIMEISEHFTREKMLRSFMFYIYTGRVIKK